MTHRHLVLALVVFLGCAKQDEAKPSGAADKSVAKAPAPVPSPVPPPPADAAVKVAELKWQPYTSKDGNFSIELPSEPKNQDQGTLKVIGAEFGTTAADDRTALCGVAYMKLPDGPKVDPKVVLEGALARHKTSGKVIEEKDLKLGKHPGKSLTVETDSHRKWMRVFLADRTIYILNCGGPFDRAATDGPIALRSLDSFKFTK